MRRWGDELILKSISYLYTLDPTPYTLDPTPYTLDPTPYTLDLKRVEHNVENLDILTPSLSRG